MENNINYWKKVLLTKADEDFFELMENWLGKIKTPFNKHDLIEKLEQFLSSKKVKKRIIDLLDEQDAKILSAIWLINEPNIKNLYTLVGESLTFTQFSLKLINLEQRMLIFRSNQANSEKILINPILMDILKEKVLNFNSIFPPINNKTPFQELPWISDSILLALFSYIENKEPQLKLDNDWKKKNREDLKDIIPKLEITKTQIDRMNMIKELLIQLRLCSVEDRTLKNNLPMWESFKEFPPRELFITIVSGILSIADSISTEASLSPKIEKKDLATEATLLIHMLKTIPHGIFYNRNNFIAIMKTLSSNNDELVNKKIDILIEIEILLSDAENNIAINPILNIDKPLVSPQPAAIIEANFEIILKPWVPLVDSFLIPLVADITKCDLYPHYQINQSSFHRAINKGFKPYQIIQKLENLSQKKLPQNLRQSLTDWNENYQKIRIIEGTILKVKPQEAKVIKESGLLNPWIIEELTNGIFIMDDQNFNQWREELLHCGISERPNIERPSKPIIKEEKPFIPEINKIESVLNPSAKEQIFNKEKHTKSKKIKHPQIEEINKKVKKLNLKNNEEKEIEAKISKKLILFPDQIIKPSAQKEHKEASGLNFRGKISIINYAISSKKEILEITLISDQENPSAVLLFPIKIIKNGEIQSLIARPVNKKEKIKLDISRIMSVRRLQSSIFIPEKN